MLERMCQNRAKRHCQMLTAFVRSISEAEKRAIPSEPTLMQTLADSLTLFGTRSLFSQADWASSAEKPCSGAKKKPDRARRYFTEEWLSNSESDCSLNPLTHAS